MFASSLWVLFPSPCRALVKSLWTGSHIWRWKETWRTFRRVSRKKEEAPFCHFVINTGVNEHQTMTDFLLAWFWLPECVIFLGLEARFLEYNKNLCAKWPVSLHASSVCVCLGMDVCWLAGLDGGNKIKISNPKITTITKIKERHVHLDGISIMIMPGIPMYAEYFSEEIKE